MQKVAAETRATGRDCSQKIIENPEYQNIKTKIYLGPDDQFPLQMLTDTSRPTKEDIKVLYKIYGDTQDCRKIILDGAAKTHPLVLLTLIGSYAESDKLWAEATSGKLSWGAFNQRRKEILTQLQTNMVQAEVQIASQLQNQHQFEDREQRQRAAAAMQAYYERQRTQTQTCSYTGLNQAGIVSGTMIANERNAKRHAYVSVCCDVYQRDIKSWLAGVLKNQRRL